MSSIDPSYYANNDDGSEPHGHWLKAADYESRQRERIRIHVKSHKAVQAGIACDLKDAPHYCPF